ncbi:endonuclease/exonuclease/phosphatase family protein [Allomuricauda sp. d1]|uniref:endonuclease/exonuclease/phosphatase family protein n=1 Tax=Allomuricauda sp. d1 TaxID=3136725 RepID=UPI0031D2047D
MSDSDFSENLVTIAFYNLENFFDTHDDPHALDDDFTPDGFKKWTEKRYRKKTKKIARVMPRIGFKETQNPPVLIGLAEVENSGVIKSLLNTSPLKEVDYGYVHFDSPDERGIDTALLYQKSRFEVLQSESLTLLVENTNGIRGLTRDILYVKGRLHEEEIHVFVNHWPSRREGAEETSYKREKAAETILNKIETLPSKGENCIIMGDFNDDPNSKSIERLMDSGFFINPMKKLLTPVKGSARYKGGWNLFDQIIISHSFLNHEEKTHSLQKTDIFSDKMVREWKGKYKGTPFRTYVGSKYIGGYSDHFPVYVVLEYQI